MTIKEVIRELEKSKDKDKECYIAADGTWWLITDTNQAIDGEWYISNN